MGQIFSKKRSKILKFKALPMLFFGVLFMSITPNSAWAACTLPSSIVREHNDGREDIAQFMAEQFDEHREWLTGTFVGEALVPALQLFAEQMSAVAAHQTMIIGTFFDAKHQLETQRLFQELQVEAHRDYQPSTSFCAFGTNVRSLAHSENAARYNAVVMGQRQLARHLGRKNMGAAKDATTDVKSRWEQFVNIYCDPQDNNWREGVDNTGLDEDIICNADDSYRVNLDIDYTRLIENRRTIDVSGPLNEGYPDEIDTQALGNNLYGHNVLFRNLSPSQITEDDKPGLYMALRSIAAKRNVAENSYNTIVGMKSLGSTSGMYGPSGDTYRFMGNILTELGIPEEDVDEYLGLPEGYARPNFSYFAQLEILTKKIYQNPDFYANLYDKPANVKRVGAALKGIELMLDRAIYESQLRQEMSMSVLLSSKLGERFFDIDKELK